MKKVLLVEDIDSFRQLIAEVLEKKGYEVVQAENGFGALAILASGFSPDYVITDLNMPEMDGIELIKSIRKVISVPIFLYTADDKAEALTRDIPNVFVVDKMMNEIQTLVGEISRKG